MATRKREPVPPEVGKESEIYAVVSALDHIQASTDDLRKLLASHGERAAEDKAEIEMLRERKKELEERNDELLEHEDEAAMAERMRDQLESLATDVDRPSAPQTPEQWRRVLRVIAAGGEWEIDGTWR